MSATKDHPLRVIQWTTGNIGRRSLHAIIGRPDMELVGVYAHGQDKVGVDAAELSGWPEPTGVKATNDIDALLALRPDACCYNPLWPSVDELVRLLESASTCAPARPGSPAASRHRRTGNESSMRASGAARQSLAAARTPG